MGCFWWACPIASGHSPRHAAAARPTGPRTLPAYKPSSRKRSASSHMPSGGGSRSWRSFFASGELLREHLADKRYGQASLRLQRRLIERIQQRVERRQLASKSPLQEARGRCGQLQAAGLRPPSQRLSLAGLIERLQRQQQCCGKARAQIRQRERQLLRWLLGAGNYRCTALLSVAVQRKQRALPVTLTNDAIELIERQQVCALPRLQSLGTERQ